MKRLITILMLTLVTFSISAQQIELPLIVYEVHGNVTSVKASQEIPVERKQYFSYVDVIKIAENGYIKLLDREQQKMFTLRNKCQGTISSLIESQTQACKNLTKQYFAYVLRTLTRSDIDLVYNTGLTTATYRNDADSLLCDIDSLQTVVDSLQNVINTLTTDAQKNK